MSEIENHSFGRDSSWDGIRMSLAEMERRLGELQEQLDPRQRPAGSSALSSPLRAIGAGVAIGASTAPFGASAGGAQGTVGFTPPPFGADPAARQSAEEIVAQARASAHDILAKAESQLGVVKAQIEQLLTARETLRRSLRQALADCESSLQQLERGERRAVPMPSGELTLGSVSPPPSGSLGVDALPGVGGALATTAGALTAELPGSFEGSVTLRVGPLRDISQVDTLEIALLQVPGAERVEVKELAGRDAVAIIKLFQAVPLVDELRRVLPFQFEVVAGSVGSLTLLASDDGETGRVNDANDPMPAVGVE